MDAQVRHMVACEGIDDILIGNAYAAEAELAAMAGVKLTNTTVKMDPAEGLCEAERDAVFRFTHTGREDASEYLLRSSFPRLQFKDREIPFRPATREPSPGETCWWSTTTWPTTGARWRSSSRRWRTTAEKPGGPHRRHGCADPG